MTVLLKDEPVNLFDVDAWQAWREEVVAEPDTVENKAELLALADIWIARLSASPAARIKTA